MPRLRIRSRESGDSTLSAVVQSIIAAEVALTGARQRSRVRVVIDPVAAGFGGGHLDARVVDVGFRLQQLVSTRQLFGELCAKAVVKIEPEALQAPYHVYIPGLGGSGVLTASAIALHHGLRSASMKVI